MERKLADGGTVGLLAPPEGNLSTGKPFIVKATGSEKVGIL